MQKLFSAHHQDYSLRDLLDYKRSVAVVIPAKDARETLPHTIKEILSLGELVNSIIVISPRKDESALDIEDSKVKKVTEDDIAPELGPAQGKGDAMWRSLHLVKEEIVVFTDADIADFGSHYITGLLGPILMNNKKYCKGFFRRPFRQKETESFTGGGRVTELTAKPLLNAFYPELAQFQQPLAGEFAGDKDLFLSIPFSTRYAVEIAMQIDVYKKIGIEKMAEIDLGTKRNNHQSLESLTLMARDVFEGIQSRTPEKIIPDETFKRRTLDRPPIKELKNQ